MPDMHKLLTPATALAVFLSSCAGNKLLTADALHMEAAAPGTAPSRFYDHQTQIRYDFRCDTGNLYVILETDNPASRTRILKEGVKLYFSPGASKNETRFVQYPFTDPAQNEHHPAAPQSGANNTGAGSRSFPADQRSDDRDYTAFYKQAAFSNNGKTELQDVNSMVPDAIHFNAINDATGFFRYVVTIPKSRLTVNKNNTVVGIYIPEMKTGRGEYTGREAAGTHMSSGGGGGMHGGGMRGGGMRGKGGMSGGGGGMHSRGSGDSGADHKPENVSGKIDWWYRVALTS